MTKDMFSQLLQAMFVIYSLSHFILCLCRYLSENCLSDWLRWEEKATLSQQQRVMRVFLIDKCLTRAVEWSVKKRGSVGDWRWSLDNIRWPLRADETVGLHGVTLLLLSCLDTFFLLFPLLLSYLLLCFSLCVWRVEFLQVGSLYLILK